MQQGLYLERDLKRLINLSVCSAHSRRTRKRLRLTHIRGRSSVALNEELRQLELEVEELQHKRAKLLRLREATSGLLVKARLQALGEALEAEPFDSAAANARLRECFSSVLIEPRKNSLSFEWRQGGLSKLDFGPRV